MRQLTSQMHQQFRPHRYYCNLEKSCMIINHTHTSDTGLPRRQFDDSPLCACSCESQQKLARLNGSPGVLLCYETASYDILPLWSLLTTAIITLTLWFSWWCRSRTTVGADWSGARTRVEGWWDTSWMSLVHGVRVSLAFSPVAQWGKHNVKCNRLWAVNNYMYMFCTCMENTILLLSKGLMNMILFFFNLHSMFCGLVDVPTFEGKDGWINGFNTHS